MIIDSHIHISTLKESEDFELIKEKLLVEMKKNRVSRAIVIPDNAPNPQCADLETAIKLTKNEPKLLMVATLKIEEINSSNLARLEKLFLKKQAVGFKIFPGHDPVYPTDKRWRPIFNLCQKFNLPLIIHTGINSGDTSVAEYNDPKYIVKVADNFKNLKIIIAHYFWPRLDYCFKTTQGYKNIFFDTSGLADEEVINTSGGIKKIKDVLIKTIYRNEESVIFGSDWPMTNMRKHIKLVDSLRIDNNLKNKIFCQNAIKIFKIKKGHRF